MDFIISRNKCNDCISNSKHFNWRRDRISQHHKGKTRSLRRHLEGTIRPQRLLGRRPQRRQFIVDRGKPDRKTSWNSSARKRTVQVVTIVSAVNTDHPNRYCVFKREWRVPHPLERTFTGEKQVWPRPGTTAEQSPVTGGACSPCGFPISTRIWADWVNTYYIINKCFEASKGSKHVIRKIVKL